MSWEIEHLYHTVVNCTDIDRSLAFYKTLGLEVLHDRRDAKWPDFVAKNFAMERAQGRGVLMIVPADPDGTVIDLVEWMEPRHAPPSGPDRIPQILAFRTRNVHDAVAALREQGVEFTSAVTGPDEALGIEGVCCCLDPDGNVVELIEYWPGHRHSRTDDLEPND